MASTMSSLSRPPEPDPPSPTADAVRPAPPATAPAPTGTDGADEAPNEVADRSDDDYEPI
jgi:hypothetical protein